MKKELKLVILIYFVFSFFSPINLKADLYVPYLGDECKPDESFFNEDNINPKEFKNIRKVDSSMNPMFRFTSEKEVGYCVNTKEYCSVTGCILHFRGQILKFSERLLIPIFHIRNLSVNLIINTVLSLVLLLIFKGKKLNEAFIRITMITLLGYIYDLTVIWILDNIPKTLTKFYINPGWVMMQLSLGLLVFTLVSITFYHLIAKKYLESKKKKVTSSIIFGLVSNPIWSFILLH